MTSQSIYKIDGDIFTICIAAVSVTTGKVEIKPGETKPSEKPGKATYKADPRPTAFDSKQGVLMVLKRKKK